MHTYSINRMAPCTDACTYAAGPPVAALPRMTSLAWVRPGRPFCKLGYSGEQPALSLIRPSCKKKFYIDHQPGTVCTLGVTVLVRR